MARVFWDTNLFIYLLEGSETFADPVENLRRRMIRRNDQLFTSAMTVGEILVKPLSLRNESLADRYGKFFLSSQITVCAFDMEAAQHYGRIRQDRSIYPADAIQLACAAASDADLFVTNDDRLSQKTIEGIKFITSLSRAPL